MEEVDNQCGRSALFVNTSNVSQTYRIKPQDWSVNSCVPILVWRIAKKRVFGLWVSDFNVLITSRLYFSWLYRAYVS